ncbi:MAG: prephenate dehydratase [Candidatus Omnitrophica bacterium]|nr:prephenate dehydratase [Candidatus Omnitrophota bacterium]
MPTIAYLGPEHTNTHVAALKRFGRRATYLHAPTVDDVFHQVERRKVNYGVVPIENSLEGAVTHTLDRFIVIDSSVKIQGEIERPIQHYLILWKRAALKDIKAVFSHPQALAQCRHWLDQNLAKAVRIETDSTAEAVEEVEDAAAAAIARKELTRKKSHLSGIPIPNQRENKTRFLILGLGNPKPGRTNKTSVLFALKDRPGALYDALMPFKREKINLTKIESRPSKKKAWEYYFFIDVEGHESEPRVKRALKALSRSTLLLRVLGSYPVSK